MKLRVCLSKGFKQDNSNLVYFKKKKEKETSNLQNQ